MKLRLKLVMLILDIVLQLLCKCIAAEDTQTPD